MDDILETLDTLFEDKVLTMIFVVLLAAFILSLFKPKPPPRLKKPKNAKEAVEMIKQIPIQLALVLDTTDSMRREIDKCKNNLMSLVGAINKLITGPDGKPFVNLTVGFVQYKDMNAAGQPQDGHLEGAQDFTGDPRLVLEAIQKCTADGGADPPEDLRGGLDKALEFGWTAEPDALKVICIITDAPCHGTQFHRWGGDDAPTPGGTQMPCEDNFPDDSPEMMATMQRLVDNKISILLSSITPEDTDKMAGEFKEFYSQQKTLQVQEQGNIPFDFKEFNLNRALDGAQGDKEFMQNFMQGLQGLWEGNLTQESKMKMKQMMEQAQQGVRRRKP